MSENFTFCPICQLPLKAISISPEIHTSQCMTRSGVFDQGECPEGVLCLSTDVFHYRDFSHNILATYRSSSDFIPPELEIKPSPKKRKPSSKSLIRSSPRKKRTSSKTLQYSNNNSGDSDSDDILIETKKPRRTLKLSGTSQTCDTDSRKALGDLSSKEQKVLISETRSEHIQDLNCVSLVCEDEDTFSDHEQAQLAKKVNHKSSVLNIKLNIGDEAIFTLLKPPSSLSSKSISTTSKTTRKVESSDCDSEVQRNNNNTWIQSGYNTLLKEPVLSLPKLELNGDILKTVSSSINDDVSKPDKSSNSIDESSTCRKTKLDFSPSNVDLDDFKTGPTLNEELLKNLDRGTSTSPPTTVHSCSEYSATASSASSVTEDYVSQDRESGALSSRSSSPEVLIPTKSTKKPSAMLSSSSDSDMPLSSYVKDEVPTLEIKRKLRSGGTLVDKKNENNILGKVKAGKILRNTEKTPVYLNGCSNLLSAKSKVNGESGKDSDSGKSSGSKDSSFLPTDENSSRQSDSAFSAESTDKLTTSEASISCTSTEDNTYDTQSDPSYLEDSEINSRSRLESRNSKKSSKMKHLSSITNRSPNKSLFLASDSTSSLSDVSMKEKIIFGKNKRKSSSLIKDSIRNSMKIKEKHSAVKNITNSEDKAEWQSLLNKMRDNCFPSDLKIDSEDSLTAVSSSCSGSDTSHASANLPLRQCPFYKRIPDTPFAVDAFQYWNIPGVRVYFLSHFHSDHYIGLKKSFSHPIYCTKITANLVRMKLRVDEKWLHILELNQPQIICGVEVTALDANHCPGSVMFLFSLTNGRSHLHVGDFRASHAMTFFPQLQSISISKLFLDTTYCSPQYCFPTQEEVIRKVIDIVRDRVQTNPRTLVVCGSYTIGKEKVFLGIAEALDWLIWARPEKQRIFACLNDARINSRLIKDPRSANVHVLPMASIQIKPLQQHLESCSGAFTHVLGVKPTGWELNNKSQNFKVTSSDNITIYGVPYSEHSSFTELRDFVQFLQPHEIVPTVNVGNAVSRGKMNKHFSEWLSPSSQAVEKQTKVSQYFKKSGS